jgi:hypothetical protein
VEGKIEVTEFASAHEEEDYLFSCTVDGGGQQVRRRQGLNAGLGALRSAAALR